MSRQSQARTEPADAARRLYRELARTLIAGIQSGRFKVGERLPAEVVKLPFWTKGSARKGR